MDKKWKQMVAEGMSNEMDLIEMKPEPPAEGESVCERCGGSKEIINGSACNPFYIPCPSCSDKNGTVLCMYCQKFVPEKDIVRQVSMGLGCTDYGCRGCVEKRQNERDITKLTPEQISESYSKTINDPELIEKVDEVEQEQRECILCGSTERVGKLREPFGDWVCNMCLEEPDNVPDNMPEEMNGSELTMALLNELKGLRIDQIDKLQSDNSRLEAEVAELKEQLKSADEQLIEFTHQCDVECGMKSQLRTENDLLLSENEELKKRNEGNLLTSNFVIDGLKTDLKEMERQRDNEKAGYEEVQEIATRAATDYDEVGDELLVVVKERNELEQNVKEWKQHYDILSAEVLTAKKKLKDRTIEQSKQEEKE